MPGAVGDVGNQVHVGTFGAIQQAVNRVDEHFDEVDVLPLVEATDVVGVAYLALMENQVNGAGMVFHIEPVAHILALAVNG